MYYVLSSKGLFLLPRKAAVLLVTLYQKTLSPDHGWLKARYPHGYCKYHPTCSQYAKQAFHKYGILRGGSVAIWRILRCNPWSGGGVDEVR
jgi:hypothetical protein